MNMNRHNCPAFSDHFIKVISYLIMVSFVCNAFVSCAGDNISRPTATPTGLFENIEYASGIEVDNPGRIHNEILSELCKSHEPLSGRKISAPEFARLFTDIHAKNANTLSANDDEEEPDKDYDEIFEKIAGYGTDALYTVMGIVMLPLCVPAAIATLIVSTTASIAMEIMMGDFLDWLEQYDQ